MDEQSVAGADGGAQPQGTRYTDSKRGKMVKGRVRWEKAEVIDQDVETQYD